MTIQEIQIIKDALQKLYYDIEQSFDKAEEIINNIIIK